MEREKTVFKLSDDISNLNFLNGWSARNERLYETLTFFEKKRLGEILIEEMENDIPSRRSSFEKLFNRIINFEILNLEVSHVKKLKQSLINKYGHSIIKRLN